MHFPEQQSGISSDAATILQNQVIAMDVPAKYELESVSLVVRAAKIGDRHFQTILYHFSPARICHGLASIQGRAEVAGHMLAVPEFDPADPEVASVTSEVSAIRRSAFLAACTDASAMKDRIKFAQIAEPVLDNLYHASTRARHSMTNLFRKRQGEAQLPPLDQN